MILWQVFQIFYSFIIIDILLSYAFENSCLNEHPFWLSHFLKEFQIHDHIIHIELFYNNKLLLQIINKKS